MDLQAFIKEQFERLESAMLKCDELVAENRKIQDSNTALRQQVEMEQEADQRLRKEIENLRQHEQELEFGKIELENQVASLRDTTRDQGEEMKALRQGAEELERELKQLQDKSGVTKVVSERLELDLQRRDREVTELHVRASPPGA